MVLTVLYPRPGALSGQQKPLTVDIVAVHGLNGDPVKTWTNKKTGAYWLRDYLPADIEGARVMTYGYNADVAFGNTVADIMDIAKDLLNSLIDKRELEEESRRPIIFIAHSLGGIVVKQVLTAAHVDSRFQTIKERTTGIAFFGTPHRGSEKASFGKILASVATTVMHRPSSRLIGALQSNSDTLQRLNSDFRFQLVNYQILTFYETRALSFFSQPIVGKHSALLEVSGEDQIMVDSSHKDMCKFGSRDDDIYDKLIKRVRRIIVEKTADQLNSNNLVTFSEPFNQYYEVPYNVSSVFTGRDDILRKLHDSCVSRQEQAASRVQKRYVIYGLGGSGKTQICLKFAQDSREKFWGVFFIDASSASAIERGLLAISRNCAVEQSVEGIKRWFSNKNHPWLLIFDNADDPQVDIAKFFPTGDRGAIVVTSRNPECRVHATVGSSKLDRMALDEAITLLLRTIVATDPEDATFQNSAKHVVETLGCLALAIIHAGATIRYGACTLNDYCTEYSRHRKQLLDRPLVQAATDYEHTVYSTWEVSIEKMTRLSHEVAKYAIELLNFFSVLHFEGISERILEKAWRHSKTNEPSAWVKVHILPILKQAGSENWNPQPFREAISLLSSFSLIHIDGTENLISLHPLVHTWIRDRLQPAVQSRCYIMSIITLSTSLDMSLENADASYIMNAQKHIDSCLRLCQRELWVEDDWSKERITMASSFGQAFENSGRWKQGRDILERALEYSERTMNEEYFSSLNCTILLGRIHWQLGERRKGTGLIEKAFTTAKNTHGPDHWQTRHFMRDYAWNILQDNRIQESTDLIEKLLIIEKSLAKQPIGYNHSVIIYARALSLSGNDQKALELLEDTVMTLEKSYGTDHVLSFEGKRQLLLVYKRLNRWQDAAELAQRILEFSIKIYGTEHQQTLGLRFDLAISYEKLNRQQEGLRVLTEAANIARDTYGHDDPMAIGCAQNLKYMQAKYDRSLADKAPQSSSSSKWTLKKMVQRHQQP